MSSVIKTAKLIMLIANPGLDKELWYADMGNSIFFALDVNDIYYSICPVSIGDDHEIIFSNIAHTKLIKKQHVVELSQVILNINEG